MNKRRDNLSYEERMALHTGNLHEFADFEDARAAYEAVRDEALADLARGRAWWASIRLDEDPAVRVDAARADLRWRVERYSRIAAGSGIMAPSAKGHIRASRRLLARALGVDVPDLPAEDLGPIGDLPPKLQIEARRRGLR